MVKINKTLTNKPISKDKITLKAKIRFTSETKATGWYSITNHTTCSKPDKKKKVKRFEFSAAAD